MAEPDEASLAVLRDQLLLAVAQGDTLDAASFQRLRTAAFAGDAASLEALRTAAFNCNEASLVALREFARMVELDQQALVALREAIASDDVAGTGMAMQTTGIAHDETPYWRSAKGHCGFYCDGNLEEDNDIEGRHEGRVYTVLHHAVHCGSQRVVLWALGAGADQSLASTWKEYTEDNEFSKAFEALPRLGVAAAGASSNSGAG